MGLRGFQYRCVSPEAKAGAPVNAGARIMKKSNPIKNLSRIIAPLGNTFLSLQASPGLLDLFRGLRWSLPEKRGVGLPGFVLAARGLQGQGLIEVGVRQFGVQFY